MKIKFLLLGLAAAMMVSCGSSKKAMEMQNQMMMQQLMMQQQSQQQQPQQFTTTQQQPVLEQEVELSECEKMAFDTSDGKLRSFATAIDKDPDFARQIAIASAKAQLAQDMQALVLNVLDIYRKKAELNETESSKRKNEQHIQVVSENLMQNNTVLKTAKFNRTDGTCRYEACVGSVDLMEETVKKILSSDEELKIDFALEQYKESYQEGLNAFRSKINQE